jgi:hypothetical protein
MTMPAMSPVEIDDFELPPDPKPEFDEPPEFPFSLESPDISVAVGLEPVPPMFAGFVGLVTLDAMRLDGRSSMLASQKPVLPEMGNTPK